MHSRILNTVTNTSLELFLKKICNELTGSVKEKSVCKFNSNHREDTKQETAYSLFYFLSLLTKGYFSENINNVYVILHFTKKGIKIN